MAKKKGIPSSLASRFRALAREWHPTKNGALTPRDVARASGRKVWWRCKKGHEWEAAVYSRTLGGNGCPYCSGKRAGKDNSLRKLHPKLAREWHREKNGDLTPNAVTAGSKRRVWWRCSRGHEWQAPVHERTAGKGCPYCAHRRLSDDNNLAALRPDLAAEWHPTKNRPLKPETVFPAAAHRVWWRCGHGHQWLATINSRSHLGTGCPYCSGRRITKERSLGSNHRGIARQWNKERNGDLSPYDVSAISKRVVWWRCPDGHEYEMAVRRRTGKDAGCPICDTEPSERRSAADRRR
ncbi:MAG: zinc-ribbon domain-containing protein [Spirochaetota bacterium]